MDFSCDLGGDRGHIQDHQELGPRSFGQKLMLPQASKVAFNQRPFSAPKRPRIEKIRAFLLLQFFELME
jgi:hypothetical protein